MIAVLTALMKVKVAIRRTTAIAITYPSIGVTRWSTARDVQIVAHSGSTSLLLTMSPDLANRLAWALLEAADNKPVDAA